MIKAILSEFTYKIFSNLFEQYLFDLQKTAIYIGKIMLVVSLFVILSIKVYNYLQKNKFSSI